MYGKVINSQFANILLRDFEIYDGNGLMLRVCSLTML